jgi:hypothetical protein
LIDDSNEEWNLQLIKVLYLVAGIDPFAVALDLYGE